MQRAIAVSAGVLLFFPGILLAVPTLVVHADVPNCDPLFVPHEVHELGIAPAFTPFPTELISAADTFTDLSACPASDDPLAPNALVVITNMTPIAWKDLWYVADIPLDGAAGTIISNFDGFVDAAGPAFDPGEAFKIDAVGVNVPLVFESIAFDGIFAPGETWHFIIDDYFNFAGLPASLLDSIGVASASAGGPPSSGSIIAVPVPEPAGVVVGFLGLFGLVAFGWRRVKSPLAC